MYYQQKFREIVYKQNCPMTYVVILAVTACNKHDFFWNNFAISRIFCLNFFLYSRKFSWNCMQTTLHCFSMIVTVAVTRFFLENVVQFHEIFVTIEKCDFTSFFENIPPKFSISTYGEVRHVIHLSKYQIYRTMCLSMKNAPMDFSV